MFSVWILWLLEESRRLVGRILRRSQRFPIPGLYTLCNFPTFEHGQSLWIWWVITPKIHYSSAGHELIRSWIEIRWFAHASGYLPGGVWKSFCSLDKKSESERERMRFHRMSFPFLMPGCKPAIVTMRPHPRWAKNKMSRVVMQTLKEHWSLKASLSRFISSWPPTAWLVMWET